jgi:hypothetical protein
MKLVGWLLLTAAIMSGCAPTTHKGFVKRSDIIYQSMIKVLEDVEHPQDFYKLQSLKSLYMEIAELMIVSYKLEEKNPQIFNMDILEAPHAEKLKQHLMRIYLIEGGRQAIELAAREGLILLQKSPYKSKKIQF